MTFSNYKLTRKQTISFITRHGSVLLSILEKESTVEQHLTSNLSPIVYDFDLDSSSQLHLPPAISVNPPQPQRITFLRGPKNHATVITAWESITSDNSHKKMRLCFDTPVSLPINKRKNTQAKVIHECRLFVTKTGLLCHTNTARSGYPFDTDDLYHLISIEPVPEIDLVEKVRRLAYRIYPGVWDDIKAKLLANPSDYFQNYGYSVTSICGKFPDYVIADIKTAFKDKSNYTYDAGGRWNRARKNGRDLSIECKLCDDGIYRAWFSSEFPGCANGDYWLLINPTTAIFKESD